MTPEASDYYTIALNKYRGTFTAAREIVVTVPAARQLAAEMAYIYEHGAVPEWAVFVERFIKQADGGYIFEHHSKRHPETPRNIN